MKKAVGLLLVLALLASSVAAVQVPYRSDQDGQLHYYDTATGEDTDLATGVFDLGDSTDLDKDGFADLAFRSDSGTLGWYEDNNGVTSTSFSVSVIGGTGDNNDDNDQDILFTDGNQNLKVYDTGGDTTGDTGLQADYPGDIIDVDGDNSNDLTYIDTNNNFVYLDSADATTRDTGVDAFRLGGTGTINGNLVQAYRESGTQNLAWYDFSAGSSTVTSITTSWVGAIGNFDGDGGKDIAYSDGNNNLKFYDTGDGSITDTNLQATAVGLSAFEQYQRPSFSQSTNRTEYDNSINQGQPIELLNNITSQSQVTEVTLATKPDTENSFTNHSGIYDSPQNPNKEGSFSVNFTYSNNTLPLETTVNWKIWVKEENPNLEGDFLYTSSSSDNTFEIEKNPLELFESAPEQQDSTLSNPIPFQETPYVENPTEFTYTDTEVKNKVISTAQSTTLTLEGPNGENIAYNFNNTASELIWNVSSIDPGDTIPYTINYDVLKLNVTKTNENVTTPEGTENVVTLNISNPNPVTVQSVSAKLDYPYPKSTVETDFFFISGNDRTNIEDDPNYAVEKEDTNLDGITDRISWVIPDLNSNQSEVYRLRGKLGTPIKIYRSDVITNKPVRPVENVNWRIGFALQNDNPFNVEVRRKIRVPAGADDFTLDGQVVEPKFDLLGRYILLRKTVPAFGNKTTFLRYSTQSISSTVDIDSPKRFIADQPAEFTANVRVKNLANKDLRNVTTRIDIGYGENVRVIEQSTGNAIQEVDTVRGDFFPQLGQLKEDQVKNYKVKYEVPTAEVDRIRKSPSDSGNNLTIYQITSKNENPISQLYFKSSQIECSNVEAVKLVGKNNQSANQTLSYSCGSNPVGSLLVDLGKVTSNSQFRLGVEYRKTDARIGIPNIWTVGLMAFGKWLIVGFFLIGGYVVWDKISGNSNPRNSRGRGR